MIPQGTKLNMGTDVITPYHSIIAFRDQSLYLKIAVKGSIPVNRKLNVGIDPYNNSICLKNLGINPLINIFKKYYNITECTYLGIVCCVSVFSEKLYSSLKTKT